MASTARPCPLCASELAADAARCWNCGADFTSSTFLAVAPDGAQRASAGSDSTLVDALRQQLGPRVLVVGRLGEGGMGTVYRGRDQSLRRDVAIKVLREDFAADADARLRFVREAQAAAALRHPGVVSVFEVGSIGISGPPYFIMEFVAGETLEDRYPLGTLVPESDVERIVGEVAAALAAAHEKGFVHRDIKPSNLLVQEVSGRIVVADFGISTSAQPAVGDQRLTATGAYVGTPLYMSPEQASAAAATPASDIYSLGCVAYELLAGRRVFEESTMIGMLASHIKDTPSPLDRLRPDVDPPLLRLVHRMLFKDPSERPTAHDVAAILGATDALLEWPPPGTAPWQGTLARSIHWATLGSCLTAIASGLLFSEVGSGSSTAAAAATAVALVMLSVAAVSLVRALLVGWRAIRGVVLLHATGYRMGDLLEVLADFRDEMGDLITGGRRYGALSERRRRSVRRARVMSLAIYVWSVGSGLGVAYSLITLARAEGGGDYAGLLAAGQALAWALAAFLLEQWTPTANRALAFSQFGRPRRSPLPELVVVRSWEARRNTRGILPRTPFGALHWTITAALGYTALAAVSSVVLVMPPLLAVGFVGPLT